MGYHVRNIAFFGGPAIILLEVQQQRYLNEAVADKGTSHDRIWNMIYAIIHRNNLHPDTETVPVKQSCR